jgi:hypothetical protein
MTYIINNSMHTVDVSYIPSGKSHSIKINPLNTNGYGFQIFLKPGQNYSIYIHDPKFYVATLNPKTIPHIFLNIYDKQSQLIYLMTTYHTMMDKPEQPCESSESYSSTACIKNSISRRIGCRLEWDIWSSRDIQLCTRFEQLEKNDEKYLDLLELQQTTLVKNAGCLIPCSYTEYKLAREPMKYELTGKYLNIRFSSPDVLKRTEELLYPLDSFVSEFGGALGLFLGFSCMMIWDTVEFLCLYCLKNAPSVEN